MALTEDEKKELIQDVINEITTQSTSIDELNTIDNLDNAESLPAYKKDTTELVRVPIALISKPAKDAADTANRAASSASSAAEQATQAKQETVRVTNEALEAIKNSNEATDRVNEAMDNINDIKSTADRADQLSADLKNQLSDYTLKVMTEDEYNNLENKDENTLYFLTEET